MLLIKKERKHWSWLQIKQKLLAIVSWVTAFTQPTLHRPCHACYINGYEGSGMLRHQPKKQSMMTVFLNGFYTCYEIYLLYLTITFVPYTAVPNTLTSSCHAITSQVKRYCVSFNSCTCCIRVKILTKLYTILSLHIYTVHNIINHSMV